MLKGEISETVAILSRLKRLNINLYALTNWSHETFPYALKTCSCFKNFLEYRGFENQEIKTWDKKIFEILLLRNGLKAEESVFVDDNLHNVKAAKALGFTGIHFTSPQNLRDELKNLNFEITK